MQIRRARRGEADDVATVWWRSREASTPEIPPPVHPEDEVRTWFADVVLPEREVWVADDGGAVAGILVLDDDGIDQLYVDPDHTGRGIGSRLMAVAKEQRASGIRLWTFEANVGARRFYRRHGFVPIASTAGDNEEGAPDVLYEWSPLRDAPDTRRDAAAVSERAGVLLVRDGRIALIERRRDGQRYYVAPGGGIEPGETGEEAAVREAREELGIDVRLLEHALTVESTARGRSRQHYWYAEADTDEFGPMTGPERTTASNAYVRVWIALTDLEAIDLRPEDLRAAIVR